ncbi:hypothetical protein [Streptomyces sp. NBC_01445]|uniref:hypothetical protein n=1 Tax=Streptomyces sp. NBC_01445 TaxID=2903869 RepID=UPI002DDB429E|nr:hypothetical protein [Streptomyces sp. NBC_01445]WSE02057.1 hypothetical protein OG574_00595 [Streptomyces sp. NBC_01445]WSE02161.1 hypothetical protein OG574_01225 [Streptomyces sp. NBC_01445]WSE10273.1 hypothetical protein OG574_47415 [Streptomyces sp. NBC_01445]WSE11158.1 hypothetical protein OG574_48605 [Streptomyces sp. NBC_01445]
MSGRCCCRAAPLLLAGFGVLPDGMRDVQQRVRDGRQALADRVGAATVTTGGFAR